MQTMKTIRRFAVAGLLLAAFVTVTSAQEATKKALPSVNLKNTYGEAVNTATLSTDSTPVIVSFWATWCKPCIIELSAYHELYKEWQEKYGAKIVAVSIDDIRQSQKVPSFTKGRNWEFLVLMDQNSDFKRAMNVNNVPHTFIVQNGEVVWQHSAYAAGDEEEVEEQLKKLTGKM